MRDNRMSRGQYRNKILCYLQKRVVVRNKNLNEVAHLGDFSRCPDKVWHWTRGAVPNENLKSLATKILSHPASDNTEPYDSNILSRSTGHAMTTWHFGLPAGSQTEVKPASTQY
jgi:hypothetical protein